MRKLFPCRWRSKFDDGCAVVEGFQDTLHGPCPELQLRLAKFSTDFSARRSFSSRYAALVGRVFDALDRLADGFGRRSGLGRLGDGFLGLGFGRLRDLMGSVFRGVHCDQRHLRGCRFTGINRHSLRRPRWKFGDAVLGKPINFTRRNSPVVAFRQFGLDQACVAKPPNMMIGHAERLRRLSRSIVRRHCLPFANDSSLQRRGIGHPGRCIVYESSMQRP